MSIKPERLRHPERSEGPWFLLATQPLDGSPGKWETQFKSEHIGQFRWFPDGKRLTMVRGHTDSDVILIRDARQ